MLVGYMRVSTDSDRLTGDYVWAAVLRSPIG